MAELVREGARTICFIKSRKAVELVARIVREKLGPELEDRIAPYRAGYTPQQRRELEARLTNGDLLAVITTDALELGIDIGALDAAVCVTFPGTVASLRQMWGRAGRRGRGLAVYVAGEDALDQFFCRHPDEFLERPVEAAIVWHENEPIHLAHLLCAAHEGPLTAADAETLGPRWQAYADLLVSPGRPRRAPRPVPAAPPRGLPGRARVAALGLARQRRGGRRLQRRAAGHGRVLARGQHDPRRRRLPAPRALLRGRASSTSTRAARSSTPSTATGTRSPSARPTSRSSACSTAARPSGVTLSFGHVTVTEQVHAYQRKRLPDHEVIDLNGVDLPPHSFTTQALWYELGPSCSRTSRTRCCSARCTPPSTRRSPCCRCWPCATAGTSAACRPTPTRRPGARRSSSTTAIRAASGSRCRAFATSTCSCEDAHRLISECPCESGCPSCVQSPKCGNLNEPLSKAGALEVMARMLQS